MRIRGKKNESRFGGGEKNPKIRISPRYTSKQFPLNFRGLKWGTVKLFFSFFTNEHINFAFTWTKINGKCREWSCAESLVHSYLIPSLIYWNYLILTQEINDKWMIVGKLGWQMSDQPLVNPLWQLQTLPRHRRLIRPGSGVLAPILCGDFYVLPQVDFLKQFQLKPHYQKRKRMHTLQPVQFKTMLAGRPPLLGDDLNATVNFTLNCTQNTLAAVIVTIFGYLN